MPGRATQARRKLERLLSEQEATVRRAFAEFLRTAKSDRVMDAVSQLLEDDDVEGALKLIETHVVRMSRVIPKLIETAGDAEVAAVADMLASRINVALSFDPGDPRAANIIRQQTMEFIVGFNEQQREAVRIALSNAQQLGQGARPAAKAFRDSIGLTASQERAVGRYERLLREGSAEALERDLRDRRFDRTVSTAVRNEEPLSNAQIDKMVTRYRERFLMYRSETIARTEAVRAMGQGRQEAFLQVMEQAGLRDSEVERMWMSTQDTRTRDTHRRMNGQIVDGMEEPFVSPSGAELLYPGDPAAPPEEVINCRCTVSIRVKPMKEAA